MARPYKFANGVKSKGVRVYEEALPVQFAPTLDLVVVRDVATQCALTVM
jgi:hypothetical protein